MKNDDKLSAPFLVNLGQALKRCKGVDAELAEIVVQHILVPAPAEDCVEQAMTGINTLAEARIARPKENADG